MSYFTIKAQKIVAFCLPLACYLAPIAIELDKPSQDEYYYMDNDDYHSDYAMKANIFLNHVNIFFRNHEGIYQKEEEMKEKINSLFE